MPSPWRNQLTRLLVLVAGFTAAASEVRAEPIVFHGTYFLISESGERLDLFSHPGVVLAARTYGGSLPLSFSFGANVKPVGGVSLTDTIRFTYHEQGAAPIIKSDTFTIGADPRELGFGFLFEPIRRTGQPILTTLTVELLNSVPDFVIPGGPDQGRLVDSYTYSFFTQSPVPEPSTLLLVLSGGIAAWSSGRRRLLRK